MIYDIYKDVMNYLCIIHDLSYSVMQSDRNSFCGDVILDIFNMVYSDEDSIEDQQYENRIFWDHHYEDF